MSLPLQGPDGLENTPSLKNGIGYKAKTTVKGHDSTRLAPARLPPSQSAHQKGARKDFLQLEFLCPSLMCPDHTAAVTQTLAVLHTQKAV